MLATNVAYVTIFPFGMFCLWINFIEFMHVMRSSDFRFFPIPGINLPNSFAPAWSHVFFVSGFYVLVSVYTPAFYLFHHPILHLHSVMGVIWLCVLAEFDKFVVVPNVV
jgi:hypothetical protein